MYLAGRLVHRSAQSVQEQAAAEYIERRFQEHTRDVSRDPFGAIENPLYLFASYYSEFLVVTVLAVWWPAIALGYGFAIFLAYLMEFMGYRLFERLLPHFDSQNVSARFMGVRPERLLIVTAYYDSGVLSPLSHPTVVRLLRPAHTALLFAMVVILATCAIDAAAEMGVTAFPGAATVRYAAAGFVLIGAAFLYYASARGEDIRGANNNASGVSALLRLAEALAARPIDGADVWLVATGSHEAWMSGMRHLIRTGNTGRHGVRIINLEAIGAGELHYLEREGFLHSMAAGKQLLAAARELGPKHGVSPGTLKAVLTEAHIPLSRGYEALTIMGLGEDHLPCRWHQAEDRVTSVDERKITQAAAFTEALLRHLEKRD